MTRSAQGKPDELDRVVVPPSGSYLIDGECSVIEFRVRHADEGLRLHATALIDRVVAGVRGQRGLAGRHVRLDLDVRAVAVARQVAG